MRSFHDSDANATLMRMHSIIRGIGNRLYERAFPIYRPLYRTYKIYSDRAERQLVRSILFRRAVVIDAGANIGIYSQFLSRCVGPGGVVHSFEPSPASFEHLRAATHQLPNVRAVQAALGERSGKSELYLSSELNVDHRSYLTESPSREIIPIEMIALDDYFKPGERVDLVKMDIQGYELHALRGATRVLADNCHIKLLLELWPYGLRQAGTSWGELADWLDDRNMLIREITAHGLVPLHSYAVSENPDWYVNLFVCAT
jgi:FkbM family methyltransferase